MKKLGLAVCAALGTAACGSSQETGSVAVVFEGEDGIREGLSAGNGDEEIVDGWSVAFSDFVVVLDHVELSGGGAAQSYEANLAVDFAKSAQPTSVVNFEGLPVGAWPELLYAIAPANSDTVAAANVAQSDLARMVSESCTYLLRGTLSKASGQRCVRGDSTQCSAVTELQFDLCVPVEVEFGPCESDTGIEGLVVTRNTSALATLTIHGDHMFFNGFPEGAEGSIARRAQWLVDSDVDANGLVVNTDLKATTANDLGRLFPSAASDGFPGYTFGGAPLVDDMPIANAWDFLRAQLITQGHFQGEGECPYNGEVHDHAH
jgi:hypothetical protein